MWSLATLEAVVGDSLEPGRSQLQWALIDCTTALQPGQQNETLQIYIYAKYCILWRIYAFICVVEGELEGDACIKYVGLGMPQKGKGNGIGAETKGEIIINLKIRLGAVAHTWNPSTLGGRGGWIMRSRDWDHPGQHGETLSLLKMQNKKLLGCTRRHL